MANLYGQPIKARAFDEPEPIGDVERSKRQPILETLEVHAGLLDDLVTRVDRLERAARQLGEAIGLT